MSDQEFNNTAGMPESDSPAPEELDASRPEEAAEPAAEFDFSIGEQAGEPGTEVKPEPEEAAAEAQAGETPSAEPAPEAEAGAEEPGAPAPPAFADGMDWYIIHTYSGFENKVMESLRARAQAYHFEDRLGQILIPTEEVVELRNGKKVTSKRLLYPGYVMVQMAMDDEIWHHVKNTPRVTGFVGGGNTPVPLTADEVNSILYRQATAAERPRPKLSFEKNETVRIIDGPFTNFQGKVDEINPDRNTLRVLVTIFGRATPVELEFLQVEKII